jgi:hypothetical protein
MPLGRDVFLMWDARVLEAGQALGKHGLPTRVTLPEDYLTSVAGGGVV